MSDHEGRLINIRRLVAWNITLNSLRLVLIEFGIATPGLVLVGLWLIAVGFTFILGLWVILIGINYLVLLLYAIIIARKGSAKSEVSSDSANDRWYSRKYGSQQLLILVPLAILVLASVQEIKKER